MLLYSNTYYRWLQRWTPVALSNEDVWDKARKNNLSTYQERRARRFVPNAAHCICTIDFSCIPLCICLRVGMQASLCRYSIVLSHLLLHIQCWKQQLAYRSCVKNDQWLRSTSARHVQTRTTYMSFLCKFIRTFLPTHEQERLASRSWWADCECS